MNQPYSNGDSQSRAWKSISVKTIRPANGSGAVRAYADVGLEGDIGTLTLYGFSVVQQGSKPLWVAFPQKPGKTRGKWFPLCEADGKLRQLIIAAVLDAYSELSKRN
jgi:DNA-binding cell septation regulator SpoVG